MIRAIMKRDLCKILEIHKKFYAQEFPIDDLRTLTCGYCVVDGNDVVITAGGIRPIMEAVIVTDKDVDIGLRRLALLSMLNQSVTTTREAGFNQLHAFVQDENWQRHLTRYGFKPTVGKSLVIGV